MKKIMFFLEACDLFFLYSFRGSFSPLQLIRGTSNLIAFSEIVQFITLQYFGPEP